MSKEIHTAEDVKTALSFLASEEKKNISSYFFKTAKGEYGESDVFIGVSVPDQRKIVKEFWKEISLAELKKLLSSSIHEHRLTALLMLVTKYEKSKSDSEKETIVQFYVNNKKHINNWDLVDNSCYKILGRHAYETANDELLLTFANQEDMWSKRIAIVSTMYYVKQNSFQLLKNIALQNLHHPHDLMHKANGWLLREMGKKNEEELFNFLKKHYKNMPRTTLRYAIEKFDEDIRQDFLKGNI